jgi:hypothetical protein
MGVPDNREHDILGLKKEIIKNFVPILFMQFGISKVT